MATLALKPGRRAAAGREKGGAAKNCGKKMAIAFSPLRAGRFSV
jgi:hypothetical protein